MKIIAVDIGTSSIKAACFNELGNMSHLQRLRLDRAASPTAQDAEQWFSVSAQLLRQITEKVRSADAVVLTGNMHALLGIDSDGRPVAPAVLWSDNSAQTEADELNDRYGKKIVDSFGNKAIPVFTLPKIMRMKNQQPELYSQTKSFMQSKDFLAFRLTGCRVTEPTDASGVLGMDLASKQWDSSFLRDLGLDPEKFPEIIPSASICGTVTPGAARQTGLPQGTPVVIGSGDLASAAVGSGVDRNTVSLTLGTAGQLLAAGACGNGVQLAEKLFVFAHADPENELYLGSVPAGGFSCEWFSKLHNMSVPEFFDLAAKAPLSDALPVFMPYILGRGAPFMDYTSAGAWFGLSAGHILPDLCRATIFGVLCALRQCTDLLEQLSGKREKLILQALACREKAVMETAGALFLQRKFIPLNSEASLSGAAIIGFTALREYENIQAAAEKMVKKKECCHAPDPTAQRLYERFLRFADVVAAEI